MTKPALRLVTPDKPARKPKAAPTPESVARLLARAKGDGRRLSLAFADQLDALAESARALSAMGDAAAPGVRELSSRVALDAGFQALLIRKLAR